MIYKSIIVTGGIGIILFFSSSKIGHKKQEPKIGPESYLTETLIALGDKKPMHYLGTIDSVLARKGKEIIFTGTTTDEDGKKTKRQSKHYLCTHCHNTKREDPNLKISDPDARLDYISKNGGRLVQGTTLYGMVNRSSWYNDDYEKKYGELIIPARDTLPNAIQLCATACSQGRKLSNYELKAVLSYMWTLQYTLSDLNLSKEEYAVLNNALSTENGDQAYSEVIIQKLKSKYLSKSPATFKYDLSDKKNGIGGNSANGKLVFEYACLTCHKANSVSKFVMTNEKTTFRFLQKKIKKSNPLALYNMVRTSSSYETGHNPYMPNYTLERLSIKQLEDLAAFINEKSK